MRPSNKPRVFLALYHRDKFSLPPHRNELGLASFHWALLITRKDSVEHTHMLDVTDAMQIDPVSHIDTNPDRSWMFRDKVDHPLLNIRLVLIAMVGKLVSVAGPLEDLIGSVKKECRVPQKATPGENCVWWVKEVVRFLQVKGLLNEFDVGATFLEAQRQAIDRIGNADMAKQRTTVVNFTSKACDVAFDI